MVVEHLLGSPLRGCNCGHREELLSPGSGCPAGPPRHTVAEQLRASERSHRRRLSGPDHSLVLWARGPASCVGGAFLTLAVYAPAALLPPAHTLDPLVGSGHPRGAGTPCRSGPLQAEGPLGGWSDGE